MRLTVCSVYDAQVRAYLQPFFSRSRGEAVRSFVAACNEPEGQFKKHSSDYTLFWLGDYEDTEGVFYSAQPVPERILGAAEAVT